MTTMKRKLAWLGYSRRMVMVLLVGCAVIIATLVYRHLNEVARRKERNTALVTYCAAYARQRYLVGEGKVSASQYAYVVKDLEFPDYLPVSLRERVVHADVGSKPSSRCGRVFVNRGSSSWKGWYLIFLAEEDSQCFKVMNAGQVLPVTPEEAKQLTNSSGVVAYWYRTNR
jgi:hypothetical protein